MAVFTDPEFASVGLTEEEARAEGGEVRVGTFTFQANGRALTMDAPDGLVKIITDKNDKILGAHILGACGSDLIAEITLAMTKGLKSTDIAESIHIHPTLSEAVMEAALKVDGRAIHCHELIHIVHISLLFMNAHGDEEIGIGMARFG